MVALLAGCRGAGPALPPGLPAANRPALHVAADANVRFESIGPNWLAGKLNAFARDPKSAAILYIAGGRGTGLESYSSAGIFKSIDGGKSWRTIDRGLTDPAGAISSVVNDLWLDPSRSSTLLAATEYDGIFRSTDAGESWHSVSRSGRVTQIVAYEGTLFAATALGILASSDDGATWSVALAATAPYQPSAFGAVQGSGGNALYAGATDGSIYAYADGVWSKTGKLPFNANRGPVSNPEVHQMAVDPLRPTTVYATSNDGTWNQDLHVSTDAGRTWRTVRTSYIDTRGLGTQAIAFSTVHPHLLYVGADGSFFTIAANGALSVRGRLAANTGDDIRDLWLLPNGRDDACYLATDQGLAYVTACSKYTKAYIYSYLSRSTSSLARHFAISPDGTTILSSFQDWDSAFTTKGAGGWRFQRFGLYEDGFNELRPGNPSVCYVYDEAGGLHVSIDGCRTFASSHGLQGVIYPSRLMTTPVAFDPVNPLHMYFASEATYGAQAAPASVYETTDGARTLQRLNWPLSRPGAIAVDPRNGAHLVVGEQSASGSSLAVTIDGGKSWHRSAGVPATAFWYSLTIAPGSSVVLASSVDAKSDVFVLRSVDGGRTFRRVANVVNAPFLRMRVSLVRDPHAPPYYDYSPQHEIRYDQDVRTSIAPVVLTTLRGAYLSRDDGSTWQRLDGGTISHSFWGIRWRGGYLYLASDGQGIVKSTTPLPVP
ncbi:MAG: hypothetical protein JOY98_12035 [Candidatus Eremiobacteraeota bacterium]|nr:hypothetical protein [Candidatus Eremiobacteraeota bacterium]